MSRVNEAMRRASQQAADAVSDTVALAQEPFPDESPLSDESMSAADGADTSAPDRSLVDAGAVEAAAPDLPLAAAVQTSMPDLPLTVALADAPSNGDGPHASGNGHADEETARRLFERFDERVSEKVVVDQRMPAVCREQYRRLAAVLHDAQAANRTQVVMVTSAMPGEGKTLTAANIALTLASSYRRRVLIIDGDLRRPALHQVFRVDTARGLADGLASAESKITLTQVTPNLALLPAGRPTSDPMAGLISERMQRLIAEAREIFDWVIVDTPPLALLPDANLLASMTDAALLVVRADSTPHALVKRAMDAVGRSRIMGVVLNSASVGPHGDYGSYGYYYYGSKKAPARK